MGEYSIKFTAEKIGAPASSVKPAVPTCRAQFNSAIF
jgi:hypothetical protein